MIGRSWLRRQVPALFAALLLALAATLLAALSATAVLHGPNAEAAIDLSGNWQVQITGLFSDPLVCPAAVTQDGTHLSINVPCREFGPLQFALAGTIDPASGLFTIRGSFGGIPLGVDGVASADSINGILRSTDPYVSGTFLGSRIYPTPTPLPIPPLDLTGDWSLSLYPPTCVLYIVQHDNQLNGAVACFGEWPVRLTGTVDPEHNAFEIDWTVLDGGFGVRLEGTADFGQPSRSWWHMTGTVDNSLNGGLLQGSFYGYRFDGSVWGNPDCDFNVPVGPPRLPPPHNGAMDALLLLQYEAHLTTSVPPCLNSSDVNLDQHVDSRDAMLILQLEAGLISRLPVL